MSIKIESAVSKKQILFCTDPQVSVGIRVADDSAQELLAGTPMTGNLEARGTAFTKAETTDSGTKGVYTVQITTAAAAGDKITIEGVDYECANAEDIAAKKFAGETAAAQVTSLLKMVACEDFSVAAAVGATDKIQFTQKVAETGNAPVVTKTGSTLVIGDVTTVTPGATGESSSNAVGILLHDVKLENGQGNAALLIFGFADLNKIDPTVSIDSAAKAALSGKVTFLK